MEESVDASGLRQQQHSVVSCWDQGVHRSGSAASHCGCRSGDETGGWEHVGKQPCETEKNGDVVVSTRCHTMFVTLERLRYEETMCLVWGR